MAASNILESNGFTLEHDDTLSKKQSCVHCPVVMPRNPKLIRGEPAEERQAPSAFLAEMQLTTEEKLKLTCEMRIPQIIELLDMSETTHQKFTSLEIDEPIFQPFPSDIVFQNFEPYETYQVPLRLRNNDKVARLIKVTETDSPYFKVISPSDVGNKVAPGMDKVFMLQFTADQKKDYYHELICVTEREKFLIPVKAIGERAVIDFPDSVNFGSCPVKDSTTKTLFVRNIGKREAKFSLSFTSPFSVTPDKGNLAVGESMQIHVQFKALKTGDYNWNMVLHYDTGEDVYITLYGAAVDVNVRLDKNTLKLENTFLSCTSQRTVLIHNRSEHIVNFRWTRYATLTEELQHKERCKMDLRREEEIEKDVFLMECAQDVTIRDQMSILQRSFQTRNQMVDGDKLIYKDDVLEVQPCEGVIWPNSSMEIDIAFTPLEAQSYARTIYCDVAGRESRLPLRIRGEGVGPRVVFSLDSLDIGNIFVNSKHSYEVVLANKGDIDAVFSYIHSQSMFGPLFTFSPSQGIVRPGGYQAIKIDFCSPILGNLNEDFFWTIEGSPEKLVFNIQGCVIGPTFHFDVPRLDFGVISYGFPNRKQCSLINTSLIPMTFTLRVPADEVEGNYSGVMSGDSDESEEYRHREFEITPAMAMLAPQSTQDIQIDLVSMTAKKYDVSLVVDIEGVGDEIASLPLLAKCVVPGINLLTPLLDFGKCFVNHPYEMTLELMNDSDLPAKYELIAQVAENRCSVLFSSPEPKGILHPRTISKVPLQITAERLEENYTVAYLLIHGSSEAPLEVEIRCFGEGPVVHVSPVDIDWGNIPVLADVEQCLSLSNESLIPAPFTCNTAREKSSFSVHPSQGIVPAEEDLKIVVTANVDDCVRFQDKVLINIGGNRVHTINVMAYGMGTTIVADPPMMPTVNFGPQFTHNTCCKEFKLTNNGRRSQQLYWMTEGFSNYKAKLKKERRNKELEKISQDMLSTSSSVGPVFRLTPERLSLDPGQSQKIKMEGFSLTPQIVREKMICHSIIGNSIGKEVIMKVNIKAEFISPLLQFSERKINFCVLKYPDTNLERKTRQLIMENVSSLPLSMTLRLEYPFQFMPNDVAWEYQNCEVSAVTLDVKKSIPVIIEFDPAFENNAFSRTARSQLVVSYKDHPHEDYLELTGGVYYPNLAFESDEVDFGCILNDTEVTRSILVTNNSPMDVKYHWSFVDSELRVERIVNLNERAAVVEEEEQQGLTDEDDEELNILLPSDMEREKETDQVENGDIQPDTEIITSDLGIQEVFDILPLYSTLKPNESQRIQLTFYGHSGVRAKAIARCSVVGGPDYDLMLEGSASLASYFFNKKNVNFGKQLYDQIAVSEISLYNSGKVGLDFVTNLESLCDERHPSKITVTPARGHVKALQKQNIVIKYQPGVPTKFKNSFMIRVGHFEPEEISLTGEGVFPRISLDLPRDTENDNFKELLETAQQNLSNVEKIRDDDSEVFLESCEDRNNVMEELLEVERLQVIDFALEQQNASKNGVNSNGSNTRKAGTKKAKPKAQLIDYVLDFGYVVCDTTPECVFHATNCGYFPVSFMADKQALYNSGFTIHMDRIKNLPGFPDPESVTISVVFDPKNANIPQGPVRTRVPINILNGPTIGIILKAIVTMPNMTLSTNALEFGDVQCGQCKLMTMQLFNDQYVSCQWSSEPSEEKKKKVDKMTPLHLRKKIKAEPQKPKHFEIMPSSGILSPGQRINIQVKFMPTEETMYNRRLKIHIAQSTNKHVITVRGEGSEPKVEFTSSVLEFGPILPHSFGDEKEVLVQNPSAFPVEIYSLEFDKQYLEEEKILRAMKGYDECNTILLPPRKAGDQLPAELSEHFFEQEKAKEESEKKRVKAAAKLFDEQLKSSHMDIQTSPHSELSHSGAEEETALEDSTKIQQEATEVTQADSEPEKTDVGELEITPVSAAIANYIGIDLTPEGRAARNRRGISIVVHGAPLSGKTNTAIELSKIYNAALLNVDVVVTESIQLGNTTAGIRARELCVASAKSVKETGEGRENAVAGALSVEAVAAHTAQTSGQVGLSGTASAIGVQSTVRESRRATNMFGAKGSQVSKNQQPAQPSPPASPPSAGYPPRRLSVSASVAGEDGMYSCVLPEDLLVEILAERMQVDDCHLGIIIDGLSSIFTRNIHSTACCILRALNNRKYIFFATLTLEHAKLKAIEAKKMVEMLALEREKEEAEKKWLEEMSEDEYDALSEREKSDVDRKRLNQKKEKMKREVEEKLERERKEREQLALLEEKRLEEERDKKGRRKTVQQASQMRKGAPESKDGEKKREKTSDKVSGTRSVAQFHEHSGIRGPAAPSVISERSDSDIPGEERKRTSVIKMSKQRQASAQAANIAPVIAVDEKVSEEDEKEKELIKKFQKFESSLRDVSSLLENWDRSTGNVTRAETPKSETEPEITQTGSNKKMRDKKGEKDKEKEKEKILKESVSSPRDSCIFPIKDEVKTVNKDGIGIPHVIFETTAPGESQKEKLFSMTTLPTPEEILDGLGLGPNGPPIPPPVTFSVIPFPVRRHSPFALDSSLHYVFVSSGPSDPNVAVEEKVKKAEPEVDKADSRSEKEHSSRSKGGTSKMSREKDERESGAKSKRDRVTGSGKGARRSSLSTASPPPPQTHEDGRISGDGASAVNAILNTHRWVIPANGSSLLRVRFKSEDLGQFDQTLNFEIVGTRRRYQVFCRGVCAFPSISREPRIVFPNRKKFKKREEIVLKKFILNSETYEFGPLLCGKTRERYKEGKYPENMETITISNTSPLPAEVSFCFQHDNNGTTFLLDPPSMRLGCGASMMLTMWAYPKTAGMFEDVLVCCVRENPEPILFKISCHGVRPELELDRKQLPFDRVLLHRKDTKTVFLRNSTLLPVQWRLNGLENLGDDFSVVTDHGVIEPRSEYGLQVHFRAARPTTLKKIIRLEVSDVEQIMGLVQAENIQVIAEAYDVALDISFPKGADGGLDFGVLKVFDESKQSMSLKNKGRYEINYNFVFDDSNNANVGDLLSIVPHRGVLIPTERPTQVAVVFKSRTEIAIKDETMLKCQIIEPHIGEGGEVIASIPVKISVRSVYSKYTIYPVCDINFGAALINTKKTRTFTIENKGEFDFRYTIMKMISALGRQKQVGPSMKREGSGSNRSQQPTQQHAGSVSLGVGAKPRRADSVKGSEYFGGGAPNIRQQIGMFTLYPAVGVVTPGSSVLVSVDMMGESSGYSEEALAIDITDRMPSDHPQGIPYKLIGEAAIPGISVISPEYIGSIFEEHRVVQSLSRFQFHSAELDSGTGVYGEQENKFMFFNSIVGRKSYARFKITNPNKISCDVVITVKPISNKAFARWHDVYEVTPSRACIGRYGSLYVTVAFTPPAMQVYSAIFEAAVDGMTGVVSRYRSLIFDIQGDGNLPRVSIQRPATRNKAGNLVMLFKPLLIGRAHLLPLVLTNDGNLDANVKMTITDPEKSFCITRSSLHQDVGIPKDNTPPKHISPNDILFQLPTSRSIEFAVQCKPTLNDKVIGEIRFSVRDNPYEEYALQLLGEGYKEDVTIDNIISGDDARDVAESSNDHNDFNRVFFGDCSVGVAKKTSFTLTNHLEHDAVRFSWSPPDGLTFSPCTGHLLANCAKDISISFSSDKPLTLGNVRVNCKVTKIKLAEDGKKAVDWDDRMRTVKWVDVNGRTTTREEGLSSGGQKATSEVGRERATKKKVYETEAEPAHTVIEDSARALSLAVSAQVDYAAFECPVSTIHFKDTLMFQTRIYSFNLSNTSPVTLHYTSEVTEDVSHPVLGEQPPVRTASRSSALVQDGTFPGSRPATAMGVVFETGSMSNVLLSHSLPFTVEPSQGSIPAGESISINVRFAPCDITEYQGLLKFSIPNLHPDSIPPEIKLKGRSLLPYCHFELEESDYITGGRRNPELPGPGGAPPGTMLNPITKVIEFQSCGVKVKVIREFYIINPTDMDLNFIWTREDPSDSRSGPSNFTCSPTTGLIESGKKFHMRFEYISNNLDLTESFWRFFIQEHNISLPFLLVGHTTEPAVSLDRSHFNFREILVGVPAEQTVYLVNEEEKSFNFSFDEDSCRSEAHDAAQLLIKPMSGFIPAKSRLPIILGFTPTVQKEVNFNIVCKVKKKTIPLTLNVKAEGFAMKVCLICEDSAGNKVELTSSGSNRIQFGEVEINERALRQLFVINAGKFNFDFTWDLRHKSKLKHKNNNPVVSVGPQIGTVASNSRKRCMLTFCPPGKYTLQNCKLILKITNGPTYNIDITGSGIRPSLKFSFNRFDFGPCFLYRAGIALPRSTLIITNEDSKDINVNCKYENTPYLEVVSQPSVIPPGQQTEVDILFYPRECKHYHEVIPFEVNGLSVTSVDILGQGAEIKVDVCNPDDRKVNFGALRVGQSAERIVKLRNKSAAAITFSLVITPSLLVLQQSSALTVSPSSEITLEPNGGSCNVHVMFTPTTRIPQFTEEVILECAGVCQTVFLVTGTCQAVDIKLDSMSVPFGAVVIGSQSSRVVIMQNLGDIGARFSWNMTEFNSDFSIEPVKGYSSPGTEVSFELKFFPQNVSQDIRNEVRCAIEGSDPLKLVLTGSCVAQTPVKEVIHFSTHVRTRETRNIVLNNRSNLLWQLRPKIDGAYWSGADTITVDPQQSKNYELTYRPLVMTHEGKRHQGSVFFPLPDGNGLLYNVTGVSEAPKAISNITRDVPCKTNYTELLTVNNWLKKPQRFRVIIEIIKPDKLDGATTLKALQYIDIPGQMKKDHKIDFYAHKEGAFSAKVIFKNEQTSEYLFYYITFKATPPGIISTIDLTTPVRQAASHVITLYNPLTVQVSFSTASTLSDILLPPHFTVPPQSEGCFTFDYLPLKSGDVTGRLTLSSSDLGFYQYDLNLSATPAGPENQVHFRTCLGSTQSQTCRFNNFCKSRVEYACKVDNPDFHVERSITAASASSGGTEVNVEVVYEPSCLGNSRATLLLTSPLGGDYTFPLYGYAAPPKPQGPYTIKAGASTSIPFKNVFPQATQFTFHVDNPVFGVKPVETIRAKKVHNVVVTFDGNQGNAKTTRMGRLVVASASSASLSHNIEWVYYLKGITP